MNSVMQSNTMSICEISTAIAKALHLKYKILQPRPTTITEGWKLIYYNTFYSSSIYKLRKAVHSYLILLCYVTLDHFK
jgi:hypothetical protein